MGLSMQFPAEFRIGPVRVAPATVLAPMAGVTDTVFRRLIRNQGGCGLLNGIARNRKAANNDKASTP